MPRLARVFVPDLPCHVTIRGNDKQDIFFSDADRRRLLADLRVEAVSHGMLVHAYVLMTNHVHLVVTGPVPHAIARTIQGLGRRYVPYFNLRYARAGTLWEGRFKASVVASDRYLLACHRYIDLNPVRAGLVADPAAYQWSSHRRYALGHEDPLISPHAIWRSLGDSEAERRAAYQAMFDSPCNPIQMESIRKASRQGTAIGDHEECVALERRLGKRITPRIRGRKKQGADDPSEASLQLDLGNVV